MELVFAPETIVGAFLPDQRVLSYEPLGNGHINDTYAVGTPSGKYVLQRLNHKIFTRPVELMQNVTRVSRHLSTKPGVNLEFLPTVHGQTLHQASGEFWRLCRLIEGVVTVDVPRSAEDAYQVGKAFGQFGDQLSDLPGPRLHETIPDFHHTPGRLKALREAAESDRVGRLSQADKEVEIALKEASRVGRLLGLNLPSRVTHNDTKINNVLLDESSGEAVCVIDLDTVMPGLVHYDFGDLIRTTTCLAAEDETELDKIVIRRDFFQALGEGFLSQFGATLSQAEKQELAFSGWLMTFEVAIRFLTDYLNGDTYFKVAHPEHNLQRARAQLRLAAEIDRQLDELQRLL